MKDEKECMKVLYFIDYPIDLIGGAQGSTILIAGSLTKTAFEAVVVSPSKIDPTKNYPFKTIEYSKKNSNQTFIFFYKIWIYYRILKNERPEIVHAQMPMSAMVLGLILRLPSFRNKIKYVYTDRGFFTGYRIHTKLLLTFSLKKANRVVLTTKKNLDLWATKLNLNILSLVYNGPSIEFEDSQKQFKFLINNKLGFITNETIRIGFAGRFTKIKNWPLVCSICKKLKQNKLSFKVFIAVSAYTDIERKEMFDFLSRLQQLMGKNAVEFLVDCSQTQMVEFYSNLDIFILTSTIEPFGKTLIEAMALGCCVISTDVGGAPEVVGREENVFPLNNEEKCVQRIIHLNSNRLELLSEQKFYYDRFNRLFSTSHNIKNNVAIYEQITN